MNEQVEPRERDTWDYIIVVVLLALAGVCVAIVGNGMFERLIV